MDLRLEWRIKKIKAKGSGEKNVKRSTNSLAMVNWTPQRWILKCAKTKFILVGYATIIKEASDHF
jgi:hypothetical protein